MKNRNTTFCLIMVGIIIVGLFVAQSVHWLIIGKKGTYWVDKEYTELSPVEAKKIKGTDVTKYDYYYQYQLQKHRVRIVFPFTTVYSDSLNVELKNNYRN